MVQQKKASLTWVYARKGISLKSGLGLLQIRVYLDRTKQKYISTGEHISADDWNLIGESGQIDHLIPEQIDHF